MRIYLKNNSSKFHPNVIWNDGALGIFVTRSCRQQQEEKEPLQDMGKLLSDPKIIHCEICIYRRGEQFRIHSRNKADQRNSFQFRERRWKSLRQVTHRISNQDCKQQQPNDWADWHFISDI